MPPRIRQVTWVLPFAIVVVCLDLAALAIRPPHLREGTVPEQVADFSEKLPTVKPRTADRELVAQLVSSLSLEQKIGQLLLVGGWPDFADSAPAAITDWHAGNLLVSASSAESPGDLAGQIAAAQALALADNSGIPLLVAATEEGGLANALAWPAMTLLPSPGELGEFATPDEIERAFGYLASELAALGINTNLTPNLDLATHAQNPLALDKRLYGNSVKAVSQAGLATIAGLQNGGVLACARQFPGVGSTAQDGQEQLAIINDSLADIEGDELAPFKRAISQEVALVMTGNVCFPLIQGERTEPVWESRQVISNILRDQLHYNGIIVTGDLAAPSVNQAGDLRVDQAVKALKAGCDLIYFTGSAADAQALAEGLQQAVASDVLSVEAVDAAVTRVLRAKTAFDLFALGTEQPAYLALGEFPDQQIHRTGLTQLYTNMETRASPNQEQRVKRGIATALPMNLPAGGRVLIAHVDRPDFNARYRGLTLAQQIQQRLPAAIDLPLTLNPDTKREELEALSAAAAAADVIIVGTWKQVGPGQRQMFQTLGASGKPIIVLSRFESEKDNREMPTGTIQYYWIANNSRSLMAALDQVFREALRVPEIAAAESATPSGGSTARPMPAADPATIPDPLLEDDAPGEAHDD